MKEKCGEYSPFGLICDQHKPNTIGCQFKILNYLFIAYIGDANEIIKISCAVELVALEIKIHQNPTECNHMALGL